MPVIKFVFYSLAFLGVVQTIVKHGEAAFNADPVAALLTGGALISFAASFASSAIDSIKS